MKKLFLCMAPLWSLVLHAGAEKPIVEKSIVVIIPSYNNEKYLEKNLNSVYDQEYDNYRVVYVDDNSKDKTLKRAQEIVALRGQEHRTTIIHNDYNCGAMANFYHAIHEYCDAWDIVVQLDGDDALKHNKVLSRVNQEYSENDVWLTNGRYMSVPGRKNDDQHRYSPGIIQRCAYREVEKVPSHLRTCYAGLFKCIRLQDFLYQGDFLRMTCDFAILFPLLEMAGNHIGFIDEILYEYNCTNPINDFKKNVILQLHLNHVLRSREKYKPLTTLEVPSLKFEPDVFIFSFNQEQADLCKKSLEEFVRGLGRIQIISPDIEAKSLTGLLDAVPADYIFVVDATMTYAKPFDITTFTRALAQTKAHVFCCDRGVSTAEDCVRTFVTVSESVFGWQFAVSEHAWRKPFGASAHIYAKRTLKEALYLFKSRRTDQPVFDALNGLMFDYESVGLCAKEPFFRSIYEH